MQSDKIRKRFLEFFEKRGHKIVPSSSLLPTDASVLFTTAGMQQFKEYYLGNPSPYGLNAVSCQKCIRTSDIDEVGDERHLTFFEMLGNFSFGGYFKKESIAWAYEFITKELGLKIDYVTIFSPDKVEENDWKKGVPEDKESFEIWKEIGISEDKIRKEGSDNFWGPTGLEGPCGPTTEIYVNGIEIWNIVFNEFFCDLDKKLKKLDRPGVDTGMGLERLAMVMHKKETVFETDLFEPIIKEIEKISGLKYKDSQRLFRILADHIKAGVFLSSEGVLPSNIAQGYILRRLIRRVVRHGKLLKMPDDFITPLIKKSVGIYKDIYPELKEKESDALSVIRQEEEKFEKVMKKGVNDIRKVGYWLDLKCKSIGPRIRDVRDENTKEKIQEYNKIFIEPLKIIAKELGKKLFDIYQSGGFPVEQSFEELSRINSNIRMFLEPLLLKEVQKYFQEEFKKHQEVSRAGAEKKFGGVGKEKENYEAVKLHTATHLLHQALRMVLGNHVHQMGSDITAERLRFDFSHPQKMTKKEIEKVEDIVIEQIKNNLEVKKEEAPYSEAIESGALAFFKEKYPKVVSVYSAGDFSKEICAGPHVKKTSELGRFKIIKEESSSAGVRRIKAVLK
jgi:alanyl-tRNA synthetase